MTADGYQDVEKEEQKSAFLVHTHHQLPEVRMTQGKVLGVASPADVLMWQQGTRCC